MNNKISIVTFNLRYKYDGDGINSFIHRSGMILDKISKESPDIIAFQEVIEPTLKILEKMLPEYMFVGQFRGKVYGGEAIYTAIKKTTFTVMGFEAFWLSPTPHVPGSRFENQSNCPRICVMTELRHLKSGKVMRVYNLHLDHISDEARMLGMKCVFDFADRFNSELYMPMIFLGDFNALPDSKVIEMCNNYGGICDVTSSVNTSFHDFGRNAEKIDYIYMSVDIASSVKSVQVWDDVLNGIYLSDHYPLYAELDIQEHI